jgi:hypothetical protein
MKTEYVKPTRDLKARVNYTIKGSHEMSSVAIEQSMAHPKRK